MGVVIYLFFLNRLLKPTHTHTHTHPPTHTHTHTHQGKGVVLQSHAVLSRERSLLESREKGREDAAGIGNSVVANTIWVHLREEVRKKQ